MQFFWLLNRNICLYIIKTNYKQNVWLVNSQTWAFGMACAPSHLMYLVYIVIEIN